ncbi:hypothetical protein QFZ30_002306 [Arthrobacter pascens]|nr:hypothetical protein [Arthrobacter pascens]
MVDARTHDQAGSAAKVTGAVTQVMSKTPAATRRRCGTLIRRFVSLYATGFPISRSAATTGAGRPVGVHLNSIQTA